MAASRLPQNNTSARIGALSVLPVFFNLRGKHALVIGGGEPAAWKAELLAQAGATVLVMAQDVCAHMLALAERVDLQGIVNVQRRRWSAADFTEMAVVVADAADDSEAKSIVATATDYGVPVNIIDRPAFCSFQFGSIVNRSPVVIGISTDGAAPILGQAIRTRIEALLPATLAQWASLAADIRSTVLARLKPGVERRHFWSTFSRLAFGPFASETAWSLACTERGHGTAHGTFCALHVNPFDHGDLTLKTVERLQGADVIFHDTAICAAILDMARREAERRRFDKLRLAADTHQLKEQIVAEVREGKVVVLLLPSQPMHGVLSELAMQVEQELTANAASGETPSPGLGYHLPEPSQAQGHHPAISP